jgi:hypothetical protein
VALHALLTRHKKTIEIKGLLGFGGHKFFCTADARAKATPIEWAAFERGPFDRNHPWDTKLPTVMSTWRRVWAKVILFCVFTYEVCRMICMTNAVECLNAN